MAKVMERIEQIKASQNFTEEQKMQMIGRLMLEQDYVRETVQDVAPQAQQVAVPQQVTAEPNDSWVPDYQHAFKPTFAATGSMDTFTVKDGKITVTVRKLKLGDYMRLAALIPKWKNHLLGEASLQELLAEYQIDNGRVNMFAIIGILIVKAIEDWDFKHNCPSGFSLSVLTIIRDFLANPQDVTINDLLDSEPDELIELAMGIYGNNLRFFTKITTRFGILQDLKVLYSGILSTLRNAVRLGAESLSSRELDQDLPKVEQQTTTNQGSTGGRSGGGTKPSSSRSAKRQKGS